MIQALQECVTEFRQSRYWMVVVPHPRKAELGFALEPMLEDVYKRTYAASSPGIDLANFAGAVDASTLNQFAGKTIVASTTELLKY